MISILSIHSQVTIYSLSSCKWLLFQKILLVNDPHSHKLKLTQAHYLEMINQSRLLACSSSQFAGILMLTLRIVVEVL